MPSSCDFYACSELEQNDCDARSGKRACTIVQAVPAEGYMASCAFISIVT